MLKIVRYLSINNKKYKNNTTITNSITNSIKKSITNSITNSYNKSNIIISYNDLIVNRQIPISLKLPYYLSNKYLNENDYNRSLNNISNRDLICLDGYTSNNIEIADIYDRTNNYLYHIKRGTKNIRILSSQIVNSALLLHYYKDYQDYQIYHKKNLLTNQNISNISNINNINNINNISNKILIDIDKYVKTHKIDIIKSEYAYIFGIIIPSKYNINNISLNSQLSIGITCNILRSLNIKYYIDFIPQI